MERYIPVSPVFNDHLDAIEKHFGSLCGGPPIRTDTKFAFICFTNRCGSNFISSSISSSGYLNRAGEFFNFETVIGNAIESGLESLADFVNWLVDREGKNGWLISKLAVPHLELLSKSGIMDTILDRSFFIMVERSDKLAQAVSYDIALQTGQWVYSAEAPSITPKFAQERLATIIDSINDQNREFSRYFGLNAIVPLLVGYESFEFDPSYQLRLISRHLGIDTLQHDNKFIDVQKQANDGNRTWRHRYIEGLTPNEIGLQGI